jgi:transglutaminase-like putative cysteine protease
MTARRYPLLRGDAGTAQTIRYMKQAVDGTLPGARQHEGAANPYIRRCALLATRRVRNRDNAGELRAVLDWVKHNIRFRGERDETIQTPLLTLQMGAGDCDDHAVLLAALLKALGYDTRFVTVAADAGSNDYSHVFCQARDPRSGHWTSMESTVDEAYPGWAPPRGTIRRRRNWEIDQHPASARYGR